MTAEKKRVLVIGASEKVWRYSNMAVLRLQEYEHEVFALGKKPGKINGVEILTDFPQEKKFDTISIYLDISHQAAYEEIILKSGPKRVIFNPGAENEAFEEKLRSSGIEVLNACTLVMLSIGQF